MAHKDTPWAHSPQKQYKEQQVTTNPIAIVVQLRATQYQVDPRNSHHWGQGVLLQGLDGRYLCIYLLQGLLYLFLVVRNKNTAFYM